MEGSGRTHCSPLHPRCRHLRRQHFNVQLSYDSLTAAGYVSEPRIVCLSGSGWRRGGPLDVDALPRARGLPGGARGCLGLSEAGPLVGGEGPASAGTSGLTCFVQAKAPASHLSVSCKAGGVTRRVTALPGGDRQCPGSGREWGASRGLWISSRADSLTLQLACGRTNEVEKIHGT